MFTIKISILIYCENLIQSNQFLIKMKYIQIIKFFQLYFRDMLTYFLLQVNLSREDICRNKKKL